MFTKTTIPVQILVDLLTPKGHNYHGLLPMTLTLEGDVLTVGSEGGPDMWRGKLSDLKGDLPFLQ
jgi:hypothetical protein|tara:strand:- start:1583 stop:1777 length:195 start_codon:yes stop_codon:yes gene_type:complete